MKSLKEAMKNYDKNEGFNLEKNEEEAKAIKEYLNREDGRYGLWVMQEILNINYDRLSKTDYENGCRIVRKMEKRPNQKRKYISNSWRIRRIKERGFRWKINIGE